MVVDNQQRPAPRDATSGAMPFWQVGPTHADLNVTNGCDLGCVHCHASSGPRLTGELDTDELKDVVDQLHGLGVMSLAVAGGEPLLRRDIVDVLSHATAKPGWSVSVITNGTALTRPGMAERLRSECPGLTVNISLDGARTQTFSVLRQPRSRAAGARGDLFEQVCDGIRAAVATGLATSVNFTMTAATMHDTVPTYRLAVDDLGAGGMVAIKFFPAGFGRDRLELLELRYQVWRDAFLDLTRRKLAGDLPLLQMSVPAAWEFYLPLIEADVPVHQAETAWGYRSPGRVAAYGEARDLGDPAGIAEICVGADGHVYPGVLMSGGPENSCGNVRDLPIAQMWRSGTGSLRRLRGLRLAGVDGGCRACALADVCGGGSRSRALVNHGDVGAADDACPLVDPAVAGDPTGDAGRGSPSPVPDVPVRTYGTGPGAARFYRVGDDEVQVRVEGAIFPLRGDMGARLALSVADPESDEDADTFTCLAATSLQAAVPLATVVQEG